jgi:hypothetical protein
MTSRPEKMDEVRRLSDALLDAGPDPERDRHLEALLRDDPEACEVYLDRVTLHAHLRHEVGGDSHPAIPAGLPAIAAEAAKRRVIERPSRRLRLGAVAAAALIGLAGLVAGLRFGSRTEPGPAGGAAAPASPFVATLRGAVEARWDAAGPAPSTGDRLRRGDLALHSGLAELELFNGAVVAVQGPARLSLAAADRLVLHAGTLSAVVSPAAAGFTVETPATILVDRGTRFGVTVEAGGTTEAHVFAGAVDVAPRAGGGIRHLKENSAARIGPDAAALVPVPADAGRFPRPGERILVPLVDGDFEPGTPVPDASLPTKPGGWSGDLCRIVGPEQGIRPHSGRGMLRFLSTSNTMEGNLLSNAASQQWQIIDLRSLAEDVAAERMTAEASAWFNRVTGDAETDTRFAVALFACRGDPAGVLETWTQKKDARLSSAMTEILTDSDPSTWEPADVRLRVPAGTDYLVIEIHAFENVKNDLVAPEFDGHYADAIRLALKIAPRPARSAGK